MLKFWKKKPSEETQPGAPAPELLEDAAESAAGIIAEAIASPEIAAEANTAPAKRSWRERLSGSGFARGLSSLFARNPVLDDALLDELETCLITADVGVAASSELVESLRARVARREFADANELLDALRSELVARLKPVEQPLDIGGRQPFVLLMVGVNGVGKTTTIGKLARRYKSEGRSVLLAAGDTFRAAAVEQLNTWGARNQVAVISQGSGADSASVIFDALQTARSRSIEVLIADTAGRLHTQSGLMDELSKIRRVLNKLDADAPHEVLLVIDGTTKGGVMFALAREFGLPIRYVGLGESAEDLRVFDAQAFVDGLLPATLSANG